MKRVTNSLCSIYHQAPQHITIHAVSQQVDISRFIEMPQEDKLTIDDVKIDPAFLVFEDAFGGKQFEKTITLRNFGRNSAFIRILPPNSHAFKIKTLERGMKLCSGLSIVRTIKYTHNVGNAELTSLPIIINGNSVDYKLKVTLSTPVIVVEPNFVDFGEFATWQSPEVRTVSLKNTGARSALFAIDLGNNELDLLVEPKKGVVSAKSQVILRIEIMGTKRGTYVQEFWVKCVTPVRVQVAVNFVEPTLLSYFHPNVTTDFTMVDFPRTYFGTKIMKTMILINKSPVGIMYCSKVAIKSDAVDIKEAKKLGDDICNFQIWPEEGRIAPNESKICEVVYAPVQKKQTRKREKYDNYSLTFLQVFKVNWKDMFNVVFQDNANIDDTKLRSVDNENTGSIANSLEEAYELGANTSSMSASEDFSMPALSYMKSVTRIEAADVQSGSLRVCLYGQGESASVTLRPDVFHLTSLNINQTTERELLIFNTSEILPIIYRYKKSAFVEVFPNQDTIQPEGSKEVLVRITPAKSGTVRMKIVFELLYYDFPRKNGEYVVVGQESALLEFDVPFVKTTQKLKRGPCGKRNLVTEEIRFSSLVHIPKCIMPIGGRSKYAKDDAYIAFPDDRPAALRPWRRTEEIKTMFARIPRARCMKDEYTLSVSKEDLKYRNQAYYKEFTRDEAEKLKKRYIEMCKNSSDYDITNSNKILWTNFKPHDYQTKKEPLTPKKPSFIPLTPSELYNIIVTPFMIQLEGIVPESFANTAITIKNSNEFSIRVYVNARKKGVLEFPEGNRKIVKPNSQANIAIRYKAENIGKHYVVIDIIINECHGCECIVQVLVIPGLVTTDVSQIEFMSNGAPRRYVKLHNPCNKEVSFKWINTALSLIITPPQGTVPPKSYMYCKMNYVPVISESLASEIILASAEPAAPKVLIDVFATLVKAKVNLSTEHLEIPLVPLNIPTRHRVILRNFGAENVLFKVINPSPMHGINITPCEGILRSFGDQTLYVNICIPTCIKFSCKVQIEVQKLEQIEFKISGCVEYPQIVVKPSSLHLRKIYLGCFDKFKFQVENCGQCVASIKFCFEYYPEFYVSSSFEKDAPALNMDDILLEPQELNILYLHFVPIDVAPNIFYLPMKINKILGPPSKVRFDTTITATYLTPGLNLYACEDVAAIECPTKLKCTEISNTVSRAVLEFSDLELQFYSYTHVNLSSVENLNFFVANVSEETVTFSIQTKDIIGPFFIKHLEGGDASNEDCCITIRLEARHEAILNVVFAPTEPCSYTDYLPVYLETMIDEPYNYVVLQGQLYEPTIEIPVQVVHMLPVPIGVQCESHFTATLHYHAPTCIVSTKPLCQELLVSTYRESMDAWSESLKKLHVAVFHTSSIATEYARDVTLECNCGASATFTVKGAADDCILTTYIFRNVYCRKDTEHSEISFSKSTELQRLVRSDESLHSDTFSCIFSQSASAERCVDCTTCPYPLFPKENDMYYLKYMYKCIRMMELYVHKQIFFGKQYYKIPADICAFPVTIETKESKKKMLVRNKKKQDNILYLQILNNIAGADVVMELRPEGDYPADYVKRTSYIHTIYVKVLEHLIARQAMLSHVQPEHLLEYDDYVTYMKYAAPSENRVILSEETFGRYSAQDWLDLLLQTCKVYVLPKVTIPKRVPCVPLVKQNNGNDIQKHLEAATIDWDTVAEMMTGDIETTVYGKYEVILLAWLKYIFRTYHSLLFKHESLYSKRFNNFRNDLWDLSALIVVTTIYCPYLHKDLKDVYVPPTSYEEVFHNGSALILAWDKVKISYHISPTELILLNEVQMVLLTTYLFQMLPTLRPTEIIQLEAPLSLSSSRKIPIKNTTDSVVMYQVLFFENEKGYFSANTQTVIIGPKKTGSIKITYYAKKISNVRCVLVLNGESCGYKYAKCMAYYIVGVPDVTYYDEINDVVCTPYIYEYRTETLYIHSPYKVAATYDIYVHRDIPKVVEEIRSYKLIKEKALIPRIIYNPANQVFCDENGVAVTYPQVCPMSTIPADFYVYYVNEEIGDFCMRFRVNPKITRNKIYETINIRLPRGFLDRPCFCTDDKYFNLACPKTLFMVIPCRNNQMWNCLEIMFMAALRDPQYFFWKKYLGTLTGKHLLLRIMQTYKEHSTVFIQHFFKDSVEYDIEVESEFQREVTMLPDLIIDDIHSSDKMECPVHVNTSSRPHSFYFNLKSKDALEYRFYRVNFIVDAFTKTSFQNISTDDSSEVQIG